MKLTKNQLRELIKEELSNTLSEEDEEDEEDEEGESDFIKAIDVLQRHIKEIDREFRRGVGGPMSYVLSKTIENPHHASDGYDNPLSAAANHMLDNLRKMHEILEKLKSTRKLPRIPSENPE